MAVLMKVIFHVRIMVLLNGPVLFRRYYGKVKNDEAGTE